ncbi:MAG TPA: phosphoribosylanthranilate isomerase [Lacunisphaera sp.]|nr:phosphoribosylanthranilate isomerase [Lacunisphaera sp.]
MINGIRLKVCGITSLVDADAADAAGADYLGFIFYPKSPRHAPLKQYSAMKDRLPPRKKVAVCVEPRLPDLKDLVAGGFDYYQIHYSPAVETETVAFWSKMLGPERLWLAPRLPPGVKLDDELLPYAETFLLDTFHPDKPGGTGKTGDWAEFKGYRDAHPGKKWILSGGLNPENIAKAITATGANFIDVNSGVEQAPGIKSPAKLKAFVFALHNATKHGNPADKP